MSHRDPDSESDVRFDNWPVEGRGEYTDWEIDQSPTERGDDARSQIVEEYRMGMADEESDWFGYVGQTDEGGPLIYAPHESSLYRGEVDEDEERVVLREENRHDVDDESLGEHLERLGEEHGWTWISSFARDHMDADEHEEPNVEHRDSEFQRRNVLDDDPYDLSFYAAHTFTDETGRVHTIDRYFNVYLDEATADVTTVEVEEEYLVADDPTAERRAGDATIVDENERALDVDADFDETSGESYLSEELEQWHEAHRGLGRAQ
ncbi:hypothetical protein OB920_07075 [Halobacteria archaeon HArc-gm2]|nr:hypothetical protein [Halobacteria archaeon HArc-gm2]